MLVFLLTGLVSSGFCFSTDICGCGQAVSHPCSNFFCLNNGNSNIFNMPKRWMKITSCRAVKYFKWKIWTNRIFLPFWSLCKLSLQANDAYLQMAIGNAPWPIGVTMVGIHARTGREKIFSKHVAHVLNDETQRKYIQVSSLEGKVLWRLAFHTSQTEFREKENSSSRT